MQGLGLITDTLTVAPVSTTVKPVTTTTAPAPSTSTSWLDKALNVAQQGAEIYSTVKNSSGTYNPNIQPVYTPPPTTQQSNMSKYLLIGLGVAVVGGGIYLATRKKPKK